MIQLPGILLLLWDVYGLSALDVTPGLRPPLGQAQETMSANYYS